MMTSYRFSLLPAALGALLLLSACETSEERAERFYQSGLELLEQGEVERAMLEFRNVFKLDGTHKEARRLYADTLRERGQVTEAMGQYLRLIEQYPEETEVRWILAESSITLGNWDEVRRHGEAAFAQDPQAARSRVLKAAIDYQQTRTTQGREAVAPVVEATRALVEELGANEILMRLLIDYEMSGDTPQAAMPYVEAALAEDPSLYDLNLIKFRLLALAEDEEGVGDHLKMMVEKFPESEDVRQSLVGWYFLREDYAGAEAFLRQLAEAPEATVDDRLAVVQVVGQSQGREAARAELQRLKDRFATEPEGIYYAMIQASMQFEDGEREAAIDQLRTQLETAADSDRKREAQTVLARMLNTLGDRAGAEALVDAALEGDNSLVSALKLRAGWLIDDDRPGEAIVALRRALDQNPNDPEVLTLMAYAHEREGNTELATERLALAVEASDSGPEESLRYVTTLLQQDRRAAAESILEDALRRAPNHPQLLQVMGEIQIVNQNWTRVQEVVDRLQDRGSDTDRQIAQGLQLAMLQSQNRIEDSLNSLLADVEGRTDLAESTRSVVLIVQTQIRAGRLDEARAFLDGVLTEQPENPTLRLLSGTLDALRGDIPAAETAYRALIEEFPETEEPVRLYLRLLASTGRRDEMRPILNAALERQPQAVSLRMMHADLLQIEGDFDQAIEVFSALYDENSGNVLLANNLASLLATYRSDAASLERAVAISRRLRNVEVPAVQDTYGWIEYRRGNYEEALVYLQNALEGLPDEPLVNYHLGMTLVALDRREEARPHLERAIELAGDSDLPQFTLARETLAGLDQPAPASD